MHEYSIVSALLERVQDEAKARRARGVTRVRVRIGEIAGVEVELLRTAFSLVRERTLCDRAELDIEIVPVQWACRRCESAPEPGARLICATCGEPVRLVSGDEIVLDRIELEVP